MFCRSLFVLLSFFIWPLCCLSFFDLRIPIAPLVSSSSSYACLSIYNKIELYSFHNIVLKQCTIFSKLSVLNEKKMAGNLTTYNIFSIVLIILIGYFSSFFSFFLSLFQYLTLFVRTVSHNIMNIEFNNYQLLWLD